MSKVDRSEELEGLLEQMLKNENELAKSLSGQLGLEEGGADHVRQHRLPTPAAEPSTTEAPDLLDQVIGATRQTEPDRAQDLVKHLVEQAIEPAPSRSTGT